MNKPVMAPKWHGYTLVAAGILAMLYVFAWLGSRPTRHIDPGVACIPDQNFLVPAWCREAR